MIYLCLSQNHFCEFLSPTIMLDNYIPTVFSNALAELRRTLYAEDVSSVSFSFTTRYRKLRFHLDDYVFIIPFIPYRFTT